MAYSFDLLTSRLGLDRLLYMLTGTMSAGATPKKIASENELGQKWDRCIADTILKTGK